VFLIPAFIIFGMWIAAGLLNLIVTLTTLVEERTPDILRGREALVTPAIVGIAVVAMPLWSIAFNYAGIDLSSDHEAQDYFESAMNLAGPRGVIITEDVPTFGLWYESLVAEPEQDVAVIAVFLLGFEWYWDHLRRQFPGRIPAERTRQGIHADIRAIASHNLGSVRVLLTHADTGYGDLLELEPAGELWEVKG
jgi:hypothetical protein